MPSIKLACRKCSAPYRVKGLTPGSVPPCKTCGGRLVAAEPFSLVCSSCQARSRPAKPRLDRPVKCPRCGAAMVADTSPQHDEASDCGEAIRNSGIARPDEKTLVVDRKSSAPRPIDPNAHTLPTGGEGPSSTEGEESAEALCLQPVGAGPGGIRKSIFGKYEVISEIARGGMGIVYRVRDPNLQRVVALKVMLAGECADEDTLKRFLREARSAGRLRHQNIVTVHEVGTEEGQYYFTMDYVEGEPFGRYMRRKNVSRQEFVTHIRTMALALQCAHENGIVHRDLKPANIIVDSTTGEPVLMDFGLARDTTSDSIRSMTGAVFGTPAYMSPEQARGATHEIDSRTDIYSLGVLLYEGLTGSQPFLGDTIYETVTHVINDDPPDPHRLAPQRVDADLRTIILKCLEKDKARRYEDMYALATDLQSYLDGEPIAARPVGAHVRTWRRLRKRPALLVAAAAAVLLAAAAVIFSGPGYVELTREGVLSDDPGQQIAAIRQAGAWIESGRVSRQDERRAILELLHRPVSADQEAVAAAAMNVLGRHGDAGAVEPLLERARQSDASEDLRAQALGTVARIAGQVELADEEGFVGRIGAIARNVDAPLPVRRAALRAMDSAWTVGSAEALLPLAEDADAPAGLRAASIRILGKHASMMSGAARRLIRLYGDEEPAVAEAVEDAMARVRTQESILDLYGIKGPAASAMEGVGRVQALAAEHNRRLEDLMRGPSESAKPEEKPKPVQVLLQQLASPEPETRLAAAHDLAILGAGEAVPHLVERLADEVPAVRRAAARSLIRLGNVRRPKVEGLSALLEHDDLLVREQAAIVIGEFAAREALPALLKTAREEQSNRVRAAIATALAESRDPRSVSALRDLYDRSASESERASLACVRALGRFEDGAAPHLVHALRHDAESVRRAAHEALKEITGEDFGTDPERWQGWLAAGGI